MMVRKIFRYMTLISFLCLLLSLGISLGVFNAYYGERLWEEMGMEASLIAAALQDTEDPLSYLRQADKAGPEKRLTLIDANGQVIYDNHADAGSLENHQERPEVMEAKENGFGMSDRLSVTQGTRVYYYAVRLEDGKILRVASHSYSVAQLVKRMAIPVGLMFLIVFLLLMYLSAKLTRHILKPIEALDIDATPREDVYDELLPFIEKIRVQKEEIKRQERKMGRQRDQLQALTQNMQEGMLILNNATEILSINPSAAKIFDTDTSIVGENLLHLTREMQLLKAGKEAVDGNYTQLEMTHDGKTYRVFCSPAYRGEKKGAILLFLDITESVLAEQIRREFSANVSHELKTPLTNILGYSQMLGHGMAKPEDAQRFAQKIETETERVVRLVDDIIKQSQLDERSSFEKQPIDILSAAQKAVERLEETARKNEISIQVNGISAYVLGNASMLDELIYNLTENAIKYNKPSGSVVLRIEENEEEVCLLVEDTGIGIPKEEINRIYERFYRVDKSHSRQIGGTGLGLSIVKHIARLHQARIETESTLGKGTKISVYFPKLH